MKSFVVILIVSFLLLQSPVLADFVEDFESAILGNTLTQEGWQVRYSGNPGGFLIGDGLMGGQVAEPLEGWPDTQFDKAISGNTITDTDPTVYFEVDLTPMFAGEGAQPIMAGVGVLHADGNIRSGLWLGFAQDGPTAWKIEFHRASYLAPSHPSIYTTEYPVTEDHTYRLRVQIDQTPGIADATGTMYIKDLTDGDLCFTKLNDFNDLPMGFELYESSDIFDRPTRPSAWSHIWIRGQFRGQIDNFGIGTASFEQCAPYCDSSLSGLRGDLNGDCVVNIEDISLLVEKWLVAVPVNLVVNGDFSDVNSVSGLPVGWNYYDGSESSDGDPTTVSVVQAESGWVKHLQVDKGVPEGRNFGIYQVIEVIPGEEYSVNATWEGHVDDNGYTEVLLYSIENPNDPNQILQGQDVDDGGIVAKHQGFDDPNSIFDTEPIIDAMYDFAGGCNGTNIRTATTRYLVVATKLGSIEPVVLDGNHEMWIDDIVVTGPAAGDINNDGKVDFEDFAKMAADWLNENMGPY